MTGGDRQLDKAPHLLDLFFLDKARSVEMLDFAGDPAVERRGVKRLNARDAVAAFEQGLPGLLRGIADRGEKTCAGDYNSAGNNRSPYVCGVIGITRLAGDPELWNPRSGPPSF
jgi:hypothetical protein